MPDRPVRPSWRLTSALAALLALPSACSAAQPTPKPLAPQIAAPVWNVGDEWEYRYEQPGAAGTFVRSITRAETVDGVKHMVMRQASREAFFRVDDGALTMETVSGSVVNRYRPANVLVSFPLSVGKRWERVYTEERPVERQTMEVAQSCVAEAEESVTVPAGTFSTIRVVCRNTRTAIEAYRLWYSPEVRNSVRQVAPSGQGVYTLELTTTRSAPATAAAGAPPAPTPPPPPAEATPSILGSPGVPVWNVGDEWQYAYKSPTGAGTFVWSVDRMETLDGVEHYVVKGGTREILYRVSDLAHSLERVRSSVVTRDTPSRTSYVWPLTVGRSWEQQYRRERPVERQTREEGARWSVEAEETVTVPAGTFRALKITLFSRATGARLAEVWYSPEVKQMVKSREVVTNGVQERELISFTLR
ncbi:MAG TPA: hypothetical protein VMT45_05185 [Thermoanaerobaculaceae bacterium]|nr:hypothetical protein [Thermoanaerobaculaceae bacterium]